MGDGVLANGGDVIIEHADFDIARIAESGQCFRLRESKAGRFTLVARNRVLQIEALPQGARFFCTQAEFDAIWRDYFDLDTDYGAFRARIDPADAYLSRAAAFGAGIRILRQEPWEALVSFILSQRKSIPAIRGCVEALCTRYGAPIASGQGVYHAFPSAERLAGLELDSLAACSLGYRAKYLRAAAGLVASGRIELAAMANMPDETLRETLLSIPGVGEKIADCALLFGFHRLARFPRDVWINRVLAEAYPQGFPLARYAGCEGVMQQYLFFYARSMGRAGGPAQGAGAQN